MGKCSKCHKHGLFLKVLKNGLCTKCDEGARQERVRQLNQEISTLEARLSDKNKLLQDALDEAESNANQQIAPLLEKLCTLQEEYAATQRKNTSAQSRTTRMLALCKSAKRAMDVFPDAYIEEEIAPLIDSMEALLPPIEQINCLTIKELRQKYRQIERAIRELCDKYQQRYTTKANATLYKLMVLALQAELQLIVKTLGYGKMDDAILRVQKMCAKYYLIITDGNKTIAPTIKKYIAQIEDLYIDEIRLEYEYYIRRERAKEEQRVLREQLRQEAAERRALELQRQKVEQEEAKYLQEIQRLRAQLGISDDSNLEQLHLQIAQLEEQLHSLEEKKAEIINLQHGKAGTVYIISNLGAFGDDVFKIGMTRRLDPQERISELSSASVPFPFDVHSFIFSQDAVSMENELHRRLHNQRINKVNLRKEFFQVSLDDLERLVNDIDPTAPFNRTMAAAQYYQSLSIDVPMDFTDDGDDDDDQEDQDES